MSQINDAILAVVGPGHINDGLLAYYNANNGGFDFPEMQEAEREFLSFQGAKIDGRIGINDSWEVLLTSAPYNFTGSVDDMTLEFWETGGVFVPPLGAELIINGDFASGANWTNLQNVAIAGGQADFTSSPNDMRQEGISLVNGKTYRFTISVSGGVFAGLGMSLQLGSNNTVGRIDANGVLVKDITADGTNDRLRFRSTGGNTFVGIIDNVSLKEIL